MCFFETLAKVTLCSIGLLAAGLMLGGSAWAEDPYIEGNGTQFFTVPYYTTPKSKVVVDFKISTATSKTVLGTSNTLASVANVYFWSNGYGNLEGQGASKWSHSLCSQSATSRTTRMTGTVDLVTGKASCATTTKVLDGFVAPTKNSPLPLGIFGRTLSVDAAGVAQGDRLGKARIYSILIYEGETLAAKYVPCLKAGRVGLYDEIAGTFSTDLENGVGYGGDFASEHVEDEPYVSTPNGGVSIQTGVYAMSNTCIEADFHFHGVQPGDNYLFDNGYNTKKIMTRVVAHNTSKVEWCYSTGKHHKEVAIPVTDSWQSRRTIRLDAVARKMTVFNRGAAELTADFDSAWTYTNRTDTDSQILLMSWCSNGSHGNSFGRASLWGFRVWEGGELIRDLVPRDLDGTGCGVLYDRANRKVYVSSTTTNLTCSAGLPKLGGWTAYVESAGDQIVELDCVGTSDIVYRVDGQYLEAKVNKAIFGAERSNDYALGLYINENTNFAGIVMNEYTGNIGSPADTNRNVFTFDALGKKFTREQNFALKNTRGTSYVYAGGRTNLAVFGILNNDGTTSWLTKSRVHSVLIKQGGVITHDYRPFVWNGEVGLKDLETGHFAGKYYANKSNLTYGGDIAVAGDLDVVPGNTLVKKRGSSTLTAHAPGACGYVWTCNGTTLASTNAMITVAWEKRSEDARRDTYTVTPKYSFYESVFTGTARSFTVEHERTGLFVIVR